MIFLGGGYITEILFGNDIHKLECINLADKDKLNIAKLTIIIFWIIFTSLFLCSIYFGLKYYGIIIPIFNRKSYSYQ